MADFAIAVAITIDPAHEGGYQCMRDDSGNWTSGQIGIGELKGTKYGISAHEYPHLDIKNLTTEQAADIYKEGYWKQNYSQISDQLICNKLFDMGVLFGVGSACKVLQVVLKLTSDGIFGQETLEKVNASDPVTLLTAFKSGLISHCLGVLQAKPEDRRFFPDWARRINS